MCRQAAAMARWRRIGGNHSLSGRPRLAERVMPFDRFERVAPVRVRRSLVVEAARRRAMRGEAGDMVDRWAVEGVVEARRATSGGIWGRVRWVGVDPSTGEHWGDTWERVRGMTADLRKVVMGLLPVRGVCKRTQVGGVVVQGSRRSPRLIEVEAAGVTRGGAAQGCEGEGGGGGGVGVSGEGGWPVGHRTSKRRVLSLVERARRATEMRVRRGGERREEEERVLEFRRVEEQQRGERGVRAERRRGGALAGGKRWVSEGGVGLGGGGEGGGVLSAASAGREGGWVVGGRLRRARLLTGGSKREFGEGLAVGAVTTARAVEEAEAVVDRRGRAGLRLRRPSVGSAL